MDEIDRPLTEDEIKRMKAIPHFREGYRQGFIDGKNSALNKDRAVSEGYLEDWYISSVSDQDTPIWTEEHIKELVGDFILIPKK